jgi:hypothetical protein
LDAEKTPPPIYEKEKCENCSLLEQCIPRAMGRDVNKYINELTGKI